MTVPPTAEQRDGARARRGERDAHCGIKCEAAHVVNRLGDDELIFSIPCQERVGTELGKEPRRTAELHRPGTSVAPRRSWIDPGVSVARSIGSLKTITMRAFSGTSRLWGGGLVRTTMGGPSPGTARM